MSQSSSLIGHPGGMLSREELALVPTPRQLITHGPLPHHEIVQTLAETRASGISASSLYRFVFVLHEEYPFSYMESKIGRKTVGSGTSLACRNDSRPWYRPRAAR